MRRGLITAGRSKSATRSPTSAGMFELAAAAANRHKYLGIALALEEKFEAAAFELKTEAEFDSAGQV